MMRKVLLRVRSVCEGMRYCMNRPASRSVAGLSVGEKGSQIGTCRKTKTSATSPDNQLKIIII